MSREARRIEILTEEATMDAKAICHENVDFRTAYEIRSTWHGKWQMAQIEWGAFSLTCMVINRALALVDAAIAVKLGVAMPVPPEHSLYPVREWAA